MARFTIIVLLAALGILGYLYYDQVTDHSVHDALQAKIKTLEAENVRLQKPKSIPPRIEHPVIPPPVRFEIKRAEPLSK